MAKEQYNEIFGKNLRAYRESLGQTRLVFVRQYEYLLAPELDRLSYSDERFAGLRPRQLKALLDINRNLVNQFG